MILRAAWQRDMVRLRRSPLRLMAPLVGPNLLLLSIGVGLVGSSAPESTRIVSGLALMSAFLMGGNLGADVQGDLASGTALDLAGSPKLAATAIVGRAALAGVLGVGTAAVLWTFGALVGMPAPSSALATAGAVVVLALSGFAGACWAGLIGALSKSVATMSGIMNLAFNALFFISGTLYEPAAAPVGLRVATFLNPLFYLGELLRQLTAGSASLAYAVASLGIVIISGTLLWWVSNQLVASRYPWT